MIPVWNDLWFPLLLAPTGGKQTITLGIQQYLGQYITDWNSVLSALSTAIIPVLILYVIFSRQLIRGLTSGAVKWGAMSEVKIEKLCKSYGPVDVLKNIDLLVEDGSFVVLVGPSGCGKSTIMQLLQRFYFPTTGSITIDGIDIKDFDIHYLRSNFGVVSQ